MARVLRKLSLADLQKAFAEFLNVLLKDTEITASVDGKAAKQIKDANGNPILMLNVFAHTLKVHLASWSVKGALILIKLRRRSIRGLSCNIGRSKIVFMVRRIVFMARTSIVVATIGEWYGRY